MIQLIDAKDTYYCWNNTRVIPGSMNACSGHVGPYFSGSFKQCTRLIL